MPLTASGHARVNASMAAWTQLVGPCPYLSLAVPHLLLPGIGGLTEEATMVLFGTAHVVRPEGMIRGLTTPAERCASPGLR